MTLEVDFSLKTFLAVENGTTEGFVVGMLSLVGDSANEFGKAMYSEIL